MATLKIRFGGEIVEERELPGMFSIGRDESNDLALENIGVSSGHALISRIGTSEAYLLEDLDSANGTFVNGKRVQRYFLNHNDEILVGKHVLVFKNKAAQKPAGPAERKNQHTFAMEAAEVQKIVKRMKGGGAEPAVPVPKGPAVVYSSSGWKAFFFLSLCGNVLLAIALVITSNPGLRDKVLSLIH